MYFLSARFLAFICLIIAFCTQIGCQPEAASEDAVATSDEPSTSSVPLQVVVATEVSDIALIKRRWQADSDQPIELTQVTTDELLSKQPPASDILIFPARELVELSLANAVYKLPDAAMVDANSDDNQPIRLSESELSQVRLGEDLYAMPLGVSLPVLVASESFPLASEESHSWQQVVESLSKPEETQPVHTDEPDLEALVDRFLFIVGGVTDRNTKYGLLFDIQSMNPRITESEFVESLKILKQLGNQPDGAISVLGTHSQAWTWAAAADESRLAIAVPILLDADASAINSGQLLYVPSNTESLDDTVEWNTGSGLCVAMSSNCRQSQQAIEFIKWLRAPQTRSAVSSNFLGVQPGSPTTSADATSWIALQNARPVLQRYGLIKEPSLPKSQQYRAALAEQIVEYLAGNQSAEDALNKAEAKWKEISQSLGEDLRKAYERSLGLN